MSDSSYYYKLLTRQTKHPFPCPDCNQILKPVFYESHCKEFHAIDPQTHCVWCRKYSWLRGQKKKDENIHHLLHCSKDFLVTVSVRPSTQLRLFDMHHETRAHYAYNDISFTPPESAPFHLPPLDPSTPLTFADESLNLAASYLRTYLETRTTHDWLHAMVRRVAYDSFLAALREEEGGGVTRLLPYACWCNCGRYRESRHRHHFHAIVTAPKDHFERNIWSKVKVAKKDRPTGTFKYKRSKLIQGALQLVNGMGHLSNPNSRCLFSSKRQRRSRELHHFYLYKSLPKQFKPILCMLWEGGLYDHLFEQHFQNVSQASILQTPMEWNERTGQYRQRIHSFYKPLESHRVVPVSSRFLPTSTPTSSFLYLMEGQKLYFEMTARKLDSDTWLQRQAAGGNCFYQNVSEAYWTPGPSDQEFLNIHMPRECRQQRLTSQNSKLRASLGNKRPTHKRRLSVENQDRRMKRGKIASGQ